MVLAFIPSKKFPAISITGSKCWLMCTYCMGRYLKGMIHVYSPEELLKIAEYYAEKGAVGLLISGGFTHEGKLPFKPFIKTIEEIKRKHDLIISVHTGLVNKEEAIMLKEAGVDIIDYELVLDNTIIKNMKHLNKTINNYIHSYEILLEYGPPYIAPHILVGLNNGEITWEYEAVDYLAENSPYIVILLIHIPTPNTPLHYSKIVNIKEFVDYAKYVRRRIRGEISLGCMRPSRLKKILDSKLIELKLIDRIVNPRPETIRRFNLKLVPTCCSVPREILIEKHLL